jgi:hypothetical protein
VLGCTGNPAAESSAVQAEATENAALSKALQDVAIARWEGFRSLAKQLPGRGIAAVELFRTRQDQTVAVFTTVTSGQLIRSVAFGDGCGSFAAAPTRAISIT